MGISSSDYDNYLATNADTELYVEDTQAVAMLCPDGEECIDISSLFGGGGVVPMISSMRTLTLSTCSFHPQDGQMVAIYKDMIQVRIWHDGRFLV